ncbi:hypothetical protein [Gimesia sp.]|uniref:hypothetical protein n=1 Tax=Gimesia sp. TaxID=2024833 RepID=UPI003A93A149
MMRPNLLKIDYWKNHECRVIAVLVVALQKLTTTQNIPTQEDQLNRVLYFSILEAIRELREQGMLFTTYPMYEANNQPDADDESRATREGKRPDFQFGYIDHQEPDPRNSSRQYVVECKRLGISGRADWILNENYCYKGIMRYCTLEHGYAKGESAGAMIGFLQNMVASHILAEVNSVLQTNGIPSIVLLEEGWKIQDVNRLTQQFDREIPQSPFILKHLWVDLTNTS